jgi:hypothetical protein
LYNNQAIEAGKLCLAFWAQRCSHSLFKYLPPARLTIHMPALRKQWLMISLIVLRKAFRTSSRGRCLAHSDLARNKYGFEGLPSFTDLIDNLKTWAQGLKPRFILESDFRETKRRLSS